MRKMRGYDLPRAVDLEETYFGSVRMIPYSVVENLFFPPRHAAIGPLVTGPPRHRAILHPTAP